ncbi:MAG: acetyl-CoA carboxylase biotin carboxyl carrier protein subunit [Prevotellaceae bacterium]|jgi:biotin carboxyl carrier protein|nr:acetyl-CoA carboxylase biotin carboxyl carrier protein subunit [Prevotellaceae bacterium]
MKEFKLKINGNDYNVTINDIEENVAEVTVNGAPYKVLMDKPVRKSAAPVSKISPVAAPVNNAAAAPASKPVAASSGAGSAVKSPLPGVILEVYARVGDQVAVGQKLVMLEAMKMENLINSDRDGKVVEIKISKGDSVLEGADLVIIG